MKNNDQEILNEARKYVFRRTHRNSQREKIIRRDIREAVSEVLAPRLEKLPPETKRVRVVYKQTPENVLEKIRNQWRNSRSSKIDLPKVEVKTRFFDFRTFGDIAKETLSKLRGMK